MAACATLHTLATLVIVCGVHVSRVAVGQAPQLAHTQYATVDGRKLNGQAAETLCLMKKLLDGVNSKVDIYEHQTMMFLHKAKVDFDRIRNHEGITSAIDENKMAEIQRMEAMADTIMRRAGTFGNRAKREAANATASLMQVLTWHCISRSGKRDRIGGYLPNSNCEPDAYKRDYHYEPPEYDPHRYSILCEYKAISSTSTETTSDNMGRALGAWNQLKPLPNRMHHATCKTGEPIRGRPIRGRTVQAQACTVLEKWVWNYQAVTYSIGKLHEDVNAAGRLYIYAEKALDGGKETLAQQQERQKAAEARAAAEELKRHAAEKAAEEARKALAEAEARRVAAEKELEAKRLEVEKAAKAQAAGQAVSEEKKKALIEAVVEAEEAEKAVEKDVKHSKAALKEAEEEQSKANEDAEVANLDKDEIGKSIEELKKEVEAMLAEVDREFAEKHTDQGSNVEQPKTGGEASKDDKKNNGVSGGHGQGGDHAGEDVREEDGDQVEEGDHEGSEDHDAEGSEAREGKSMTVKLMFFIIPVLLLLLGLLAFFILRGRSNVEVGEDVGMEGVSTKEKETKKAADFDDDI